MESPLDFFRRNQKTMLPVIAIGCMVAFVVLPGLLGLLSERHQQGNDRNPVLFKWQGGDLTQRELQQEISDHQRLAYLFTRVNLQKVALSMPQMESSQQLMNAYYGMFQNQFRQEYPGPTNFDSAADAKIFDQLGKELGIVVSEQRVDQFLHELCGTPAVGADGKPTGKYQTIVTAAKFDAIMADMAKSDTGFTQDRLFTLLQRMFTRKEVEQLFSLTNIYTAETPLARWENYRRIRQRASIQAIPVNVSDFVATVGEPKDDELKKFFDAGKDKLPDPNSPEPGFRLPVRASFQLAQVNMATLISSFKPRIDNKAISDYYEKHKVALFEKKQVPDLDPTKPGETKPVDPTAPESKPGETKPADSKPADSGAKEAPKTEPAKTEPAKTEPAKTEPAKPEPAKTEPEAPKKQSQLTRDGLLPVNFQADAKKEPAKDAPKATEPAAKEPATKEPAAEPAKSEATKGEPAKEPASSKPVEYVPLAEVEGEIRNTLATEQANEHADMLLKKIEDEMYAYKKRRDRALGVAEDASKAKPEVFDITKVIAGIDPTIEGEVLTLVSRDQFAKNPVSNSQTVFSIPNRQTGETDKRVLQLKDVALSEKFFPLFEPYRPTASSGRYLIWKIEQRGEEEASLADEATKKQVVASWKMVEARKAAEKQAKEYAEAARTAIKTKMGETPTTLVNLFNDKVLPISPVEISGFAWISLPTHQGERPGVSKVPGLDQPGNDFMKEVFSLKQGQVGTAPNLPKTVYYVVQVTQADDLTKLRETFMQDVRTPEGWRQFEGANFEQQVTEAKSFYERLRERYKLVATGNQPFLVSGEQQ